MLWALVVPALLLAAAGSTVPPPTVVQLQQGRTYRFTFELQTRAPTDAELREVADALSKAGAYSVLVLRGPPALAMFTQRSAVTRTLEIGRVYAPFWKVATASVMAIRLLSVEEVAPGDQQLGSPLVGLGLLKLLAGALSPIPLPLF